MGRAVQWDAFHTLIEPYAARLPYMVSVGNHEFDYSGGGSGSDPSNSTNWKPVWGNFGDDSGCVCSPLVNLQGIARQPPATYLHCFISMVGVSL